jgi:probable rRNA maturation factor
MEKPFVRFGYADRKLGLSNKRSVQTFLANLVKGETNCTCQLQYVFCSDEFLHNMNLSFLHHDDFTDIITFDLAEKSDKIIKGEIYISVDRVAANAKELGVSFHQEVLRVIFHGALHLCGYSDKSKSAKVVMRSREDFFLKEYGVL